MDKQQLELERFKEEFDEKFAKINDIHRGECVITDVTGTNFQAHTENGKVTEIGGLECIKDFFLSHLPSLMESCLPEEKELWEPIPFPKGKEDMYDLDNETLEIVLKNAREMRNNQWESGFNQAIQQTRSNIKELTK